MKTILLIEDHHGMRLLVKDLLMREPDFYVVAEAEDGAAGFQLARELQPDLLITDLNLPKLHGLGLIALVHESCPRTRIIVISIHADQAYISQALFNGAAAYVVKDAIAEQLIAAARQALKTRSAPPGRSQAAGPAKPEKIEKTNSPGPGLTNRERSIIELLGKGYSSAEVIRCLNLRAGEFVRIYASLMRKLRLSSQSDVVAYARKKRIT